MKKIIFKIRCRLANFLICNRIGLNRQLNLFRHWLGVYPRFGLNGRCQWCGETKKCLSWKQVQEKMKVDVEKMELEMKKLI